MKAAFEDGISQSLLILKDKSIFIHPFMVWWVIPQKNVDD